MKKILIIISFIISPVLLFGESGDGKSPGTAYYGTITTTRNWTVTYNGGTIYVGQGAGNEDLFVDSGGALTIDPGVTVIFCTTTSDLVVQNTGQLFAGGSGSPVIFTRYYPTYSHWGHISIRSTAGSSSFNNCKIEYGNVSSTSLLPADPNQYGGGIHADLTSLTITNCEFLYNSAGWGGAIFVGDGKAPTISNCYIHNNTATTSGGGVYFWKNSSAIFTNSIITLNSCTGAGGGGGIFLGGAAKGVKIINCTISNNSATSQSLGYNVKIFNNTATPKPQFINSIIWNPANSVVGSIYSSDFYYCAIQDPPLTSYTGCISLNALNEGTSPDGPFFASMSGNSWPLQFKSPCRDAGTTPTPAVPNDYIENPRVYNYDMGAYEYQYSRWKTTAGSTDWSTSSNWDGGVPSGSKDVLIPSGASKYPTASPGPDFTIGTGKYMVLKPGAQATLGALTNNGILNLESDATGISSLITTTYSGNDANVQLFLTGGVGTPSYRWHYISSPFTSLNTSYFTGTTNNLATWVESLASSDLMIGWVAYDGFVYHVDVNPPYSGSAYAFSNLASGKGYNCYYSSDHLYTLQGQLNSSSVDCALSYTLKIPDEPTRYGLNLLGNPFSSGLDWDEITFGAFALNYPDGTSKVLHYTREGDHVYYINGTGSAPGVTGIIPPMQGFFTKTYSQGHTITLPLINE